MQKVKKIVTNNRTDMSGVINHHSTGKSRFERKYTQPPKNNKRHRINCSFSSTEYQQFLNYSKAFDIKPSTFLKEAAFSYIKNKRIVPPVLSEKISQIISLTGQISNNICQLRRFTENETQLFYLDKCKKKVLSIEDELEAFVNRAKYSSFLEKRTEQLLTYIRILAERVDVISNRYRAAESELELKDIGKVEDVMKHLHTAIINFINYSVSVRTNQ